ncbi:non-ribosomal peptide synthetase, partial [Rhizobium rhizogenes]|uniref:non-ribosomal peptide synthetase n=1 Tax=Rhizobium rhizogenes TaxID=359 RepID=UPI001573536C
TILLDAAVKDPLTSVARLPLMTPQQKNKILRDSHGGNTLKPSASLLQRFEGSAAASPNAIAVSSPQGKLSYAQLNIRASRLAIRLKKMGIGPETFVAIALEPSLEITVALLGILKAGGAYVPLDPTAPLARAAKILDDCGAKVLISCSAFFETFISRDLTIIDIQEVQNDTSADLDVDVAPASSSGNAVYLLYTSGSTGSPKGVVVEDRHATAYLDAIVSKLHFRPGMHYAMVQPLSVDACNTVLLPSLFAGGTLHIFPREVAADPVLLRDYFNRHPIDVLKITPSHLSALLEASPERDLLPRFRLVLGGEASSWSFIDDVVLPISPPALDIIIHYGPTETTVGVLTHTVGPSSPRQATYVPLGSSLTDTVVYILDDEMELVPVGVPGEIYVGGANVARGYFRQAGLTAERYVPDPFGSTAGARLYRTGDIGRRLPSGEIEFLGRIDQQVKINGFRVELGEIVSVLQQHPGVQQAVVAVKEHKLSGRRLVAYVVRRPGYVGATSSAIGKLTDDIQAFSREQLPDYMIPAAFVQLDAIPLTAQGKVDLQALPSALISSTALKQNTVLPRTALERELADIWEQLLGVQSIGVDDDFFVVGGHSLLAIRVLGLLRQRMQRQVTIATFFRHRTIAKLAAILSRGDAPSSSTLLEFQPGDGRPVCFVHPVGGSAFCYLPLADRLQTTQPLFGIQSVSHTPRATGGTIDSIANGYLAEIESACGCAPSAIIGWSMGGLIAFEMVRQLRDSGRDQAKAILVDTHPPLLSGSPVPERSSMYVRFAGDIARLHIPGWQQVTGEFLSAASNEREKILRDALIREGALQPETADDDLRSLFGVYARNVNAAERYVLQSIDQPVILVTTASSAPTLTNFWSQWAPIEAAYSCATDHYGLLQPPNVQTVARHLQNHLDIIEDQRPHLKAQR